LTGAVKFVCGLNVSGLPQLLVAQPRPTAGPANCQISPCGGMFSTMWQPLQAYICNADMRFVESPVVVTRAQ
jgi:hypothetical protein